MPRVRENSWEMFQLIWAEVFLSDRNNELVLGSEISGSQILKNRGNDKLIVSTCVYISRIQDIQLHFSENKCKKCTTMRVKSHANRDSSDAAHTSLDFPNLSESDFERLKKCSSGLEA